VTAYRRHYSRQPLSDHLHQRRQQPHL